MMENNGVLKRHT